MASYYDEHNCEPLEAGQEPNHFLHLARLLIDSGLAARFQMEYERIFSEQRKRPPASKAFVQNLKVLTVAAEGTDCTICMKEFEIGEPVKQLPCHHIFHASCILPWLNITNSCPVCREELPTDDEDYEEYKKQKERTKQQQAMLEALHDSMFG